MSRPWTVEQLRAINAEGNNIIVSAGAGSGKTAVLTARILRKLKNNIPLSSLIVLTFTNAAAAEMKHRIKEEILKDEQISHLANEVDNSNITTFDAFALSFVKKYHYLLGFNKNIQIGEAAILQHELSLLLENILDELYASKDEEFLRIIATYYGKNDEGFKKEMLSMYNILELKANLENYLDNYFIFHPLSNIDQDINLYLEIFVYSPLKYLKKLLDEMLIVNNEEKDLSSFEEVINKFTTLKTYQEIKTFFPRLPNLPKNCNEEVKEIKSLMSETLKIIQKGVSYPDLTYIKSYLLANQNMVSKIISIIKQLNTKFIDLKRQYQLFSFIDIAKMSISLLKNHPDILRQLKENTSEILVDEYQDTNDLQEEFLSLIARNNVYMVGDIKQSIYRFRNANPAIFKNKYDLFKEDNTQGIKIDLSVNFRSRREVIDAINLTFNQLMNNDLGGLQYQKDHLMHFGNKKYDEDGKLDFSSHMQFLTYQHDKESSYSKKEIEIFTIALDIKKKIEDKYPIFDKRIRSCEYQDFCILLERKSDFLLYKKIFTYLDVPLAIIDDKDITSDTLIYLINNLLNLLLLYRHNEKNNLFRFCYTSVARSFLFSYSDQEIFMRLLNNNFENDQIINLLNSIDLDLDFCSNNELVDTLIYQFKFYEKLPLIGNIDQNMAQIEYIYRLCDSIGALHLHGEEFIEYLSKILKNDFDIKIATKPTISNSVRIMSIHKSKGLEFPVVYLASLSSRFENKEIKNKFIYSSQYGLITPYYDDGIGISIYKELYKVKENYDELCEKIRLLYVAMTRAKERLILVGDLSKDTSKPFALLSNLPYKSFISMFAAMNTSLTPYTSEINPDQLQISNEYLFDKVKPEIALKGDHQKIIYNTINIENNLIYKEKISKASEALIDKTTFNKLIMGSKLHEYLEYLDFRNPDLSFIDKKYHDIINSFLKNELLNNISHATIYKEYEFIFLLNNQEYHGVIDLMLVYDDHIDIIDYKFKNIDDEAYLKQLKIYKKYLEENSDKPIYLYLYSLINRYFVKVSDEEISV